MKVSTLRTVAGYASLGLFFPQTTVARIGLGAMVFYFGSHKAKDKEINLDLVRPSTLMRLTEDTIISLPKSVARRAKRFGKAVHIEYEARMIDRAQHAIAKEQARLRSLSPDELKALARDQAVIFERAEQLAAQRRGEVIVAPRKSNRKAPRASHASS